MGQALQGQEIDGYTYQTGHHEAQRDQEKSCGDQVAEVASIIYWSAYDPDE
jgi:hypothetical protein